MKTLRYAWIFLCCLPIPLIAQQSSPAAGAPNQPVPLHAPSRETTLDVVVVDKAETPVAGLQQQDFELVDNKRPQKILSFQAVQRATPGNPVEAILLVDTVNASFSQLSSERIELEKFLMQNGGHLPVPVSIVFYSDKGINTQQGASSDGKTEIAFLDQNETSLSVLTRAQGVSGDFDRIARSLQALRTVAVQNLNTPGRKLFIWVSPGWPIPPMPVVDLGSKEKQQVFDTIVTVSGLLQVGRITVYSVDPLGTEDAGGIHADRYKDFMNEIKNAGQAEVGNLALGVIATQSGGRVLYGSNDIGGEITRCLQDADAFYTLTLNMPRADRPNEYHRLEIKIGKPGLKARARTMYYAQP
ncbi:MAG: VWA domain-containing protein [Silvibacterium sp.]